jgi:RimJ/RimL family protein N-acetyltransferase
MLTGKLVRLRAYEDTDLERVVAWINDREVTQWLSARYPLSTAQEREWLDRVMKRPASEGLSLAIETLADFRHIGTISIHPISVESGNAELGIMIGDKGCWSRGYGTDAILTLLEFAFLEMNLHRVQLDALDSNERAIACYKKCGFVEEGRKRESWYQAGAYHDLVFMGVLLEEFRASNANA